MEAGELSKEAMILLGTQSGLHGIARKAKCAGTGCTESRVKRSKRRFFGPSLHGIASKAKSARLFGGIGKSRQWGASVKHQVAVEREAFWGRLEFQKRARTSLCVRFRAADPPKTCFYFALRANPCSPPLPASLCAQIRAVRPYPLRFARKSVQSALAWSRLSIVCAFSAELASAEFPRRSVMIVSA